MQRTSNSLCSLLKIAACAVLVLGTASLTQAADDKKADPTGTWTWTRQGQDGQSREQSMKLKLDGEKLTGTVAGRARGGGEATDSPIEEAKLKGDEISFKVTRTFNDNKIVTKYTGKISGDTIKGKIEFDRNGETQSRDWEAKRKKDAAK